MAALNGQATYDAVAADPDFQSLGDSDKIKYLREAVVPNVDSDFKGLDPFKQTQYIRDAILPNVTKTGNGNLGDLTSGFLGETGQQLSAGLYDAPEPTTALGQVGSIGGSLAGGFGNSLAGAGVGAALGSIVPGVGTVIGGTVGGLAGAGLGFFGRDIRRQVDEARPNINYNRAAVSGITAAAAQAIPGGNLFKRMLIDGGVNALGATAEQAVDGGVKDPLAIAQAGAFGAGGAIAGHGAGKLLERFKIPQPTQAPVGLNPFKQAKPLAELNTAPQNRTYKRTLPQLEITDSSKARPGIFGYGKRLPEQRPSKLYASANEQDATTIRAAGKTALEDYHRIESISPERTHKEKLNKLNQIHTTYHKLDHPSTPPKARAAAQEVKANVQREYHKLTATKNQEVAQATGKKPQRTIYNRADKEAVYKTVSEKGFIAHQKGSEAKARFKNFVSQHHPLDRQEINARIHRKYDVLKTEQATASLKAIAEKHVAAEELATQKLKTAVEDANLKTELEKQTLEAKKANVPHALTEFEIDARANKLLEHHLNKEDGQLAVLKSKITKNSKADFSKLVGVPRGEAVNRSYERVLDRFAQKKAEHIETARATTKEATQAQREATTLKLKAERDLEQTEKKTLKDQTLEEKATKIVADKALAEKEKIEALKKKEILQNALNALTSPSVSVAERAGIKRQFELRTQDPKQALAIKTVMEQVTSNALSSEEKKAIIKAFELPPPEKIAAIPDILSDVEIEARATKLLGHAVSNESGQLAAARAETSKASKADYTKLGATVERSEAIKLSHQQVLDQFSQKVAELKESRLTDKTPAAPVETLTAPKSKLSSSQVQKALERATNRGFSTETTPAGMRKALAAAIEAKEATVNVYHAEGGTSGKGGESENANFMYKYDSPYAVVNGKNDALHVITNEGQKHSRLFASEAHDSKLISVTRTGDAAPYRLDANGSVIDIQTGKGIKQESVSSIRTSEIQAKIDQTAKLLSSKNFKVGNLVETLNDLAHLTKGLDPSAAEEAINQSGQHKEIYNLLTGQPC